MAQAMEHAGSTQEAIEADRSHSGPTEAEKRAVDDPGAIQRHAQKAGNPPIELRPHQKTAVVMLRDAIKAGHKRIVLMASCSFGKTRVAAFMAASGAARGRRTIFVADRIELIDQASAAFDALGISHGIIQADHPRRRPNEAVQIASIQTLAAKRVRQANIDADIADGKEISASRADAAVMPTADIIIIDEVHTLFAEHKKLIASNPDAICIGLSATPWTKGLGKIYETVVNPITVQELIDAEFLIEPVVYGPPNDLDLSKVRVVAGEYRDDDLAEAVNQKTIVGEIVAQWMKLAYDEPTICFAVDVNHSKAIVEQFVKAGISAEHIDGYETDKQVRRDKIDRFRQGKIKVLSSVDILSKGFDYPGARCAIMARPTKSRMLFIQQLGRIMRIDPDSGKQSCTVIDHAGNHERLGFVTDEFCTELDMGKKATSESKKKEAREEPLPKKCPSCNFIKPAKVHKCPACGFEPRGPDKVAVIQAELVPISKKKAVVKELAERFGSKQEVYSMLGMYCQERGYSDGFRANKFKTIFAEWPKGLHDGPKCITAELRSWLKAEQIRFAKSNRKDRAAI